MLEAVFWGVCLRVVQATVQAAPFIFTGLCVMGMLHRLMGHAHTKWLFGSNTLASLFQSWLIGMLLPGCSLGTIPIVKQLKASGIAIGTIFAFALSSPLFDPLSLLYGLTLSKPETIVAFAFFSLLVVTITGGVFDWMFPETEQEEPEPPPRPPGLKRLLAVLVVMARESVSSTTLLIGCGLLGTGLLSAALPPGSLQRTMAHDNPYSPLVMTGVALPAYATPMTAMGQLGSMFQHGNSIGAAFILLIFGAGMNAGLFIWMVWNYGWKRSLMWMGLMLSIVLALSYGIERPFYPSDIEPANHTHAFDNYCQPFHAGSPPAIGYPAEILRRVRLETHLHEWCGAALMLGLFSLGGALQWLDRRWVIEDWLNRPVETRLQSGWDRPVPRPVLVGAGVIVLVAASLVGCFVYYPQPTEALEELRLANTEALSGALGGQKAHSLHWIPVCETWTRRLQVGAYLRYGGLSDYHRMKAKRYQHRLELLEHALEDGDPPNEIQRAVSAAAGAQGRLSSAFRRELP